LKVRLGDFAKDYLSANSKHQPWPWRRQGRRGKSNECNRLCLL